MQLTRAPTPRLQLSLTGEKAGQGFAPHASRLCNWSQTHGRTDPKFPKETPTHIPPPLPWQPLPSAPYSGDVDLGARAWLYSERTSHLMHCPRVTLSGRREKTGPEDWQHQLSASPTSEGPTTGEWPVGGEAIWDTAVSNIRRAAMEARGSTLALLLRGQMDPEEEAGGNHGPFCMGRTISC